MEVAAHEVSDDEILADFDELIAAGRLSGARRDPAIIDPAELAPSLVKKRGKGNRFIVGKAPSRRTLLRRWTRIFGTTVAPRALFDALSAKTHEFEHCRNTLLFTRNRILYDTEIHRGDENIGELTLSFAVDRNFLKGTTRRVVFIEHLRLSVQRAGYASGLFQSYERLFHDLGFDEFRLNASMSIGKYYWAKEGFDFSDRSEAGRRRAELLAFIAHRGLTIDATDIESLTHARDFASFRRDLKVPVYRNAEGFYSSKRDEQFCDEVSLPLGKAFLLCSTPWEGTKPIATRC